MKKNVRTLVYLLLALIFAMSAFCLASCDETDDNAERIQITFKQNGVLHSSLTVTLEQALKIHQLPSEQYAESMTTSVIGYTFGGWYSLDGVKYFDADGKKVPDLLIDRDITLVAKFIPKNFNFILNAGSQSFADGASKKTLTVAYESAMPEFPAPVLTDPSLEFDGYFDANGTRYSNGTVPVAGTLNKEGYPALSAVTELTAAYRERTVTLVIDYNDGSLETETLELAYGAPLPDLSAYTKDTGAEAVAGWSANPYNEVALPETVTEDMRVYAVWQRYKTVNFILPDRTAREVKFFEETNRITLPTLEVPGYRLLGWYLTNSLSGNKVESVHFSTMQNTYWGNWETAEYTLTFSAKDTAVSDMTYYYGDTTALPIPTVTGYTFRGWYVDNPEESFFAIPETLWGDVTLTANLVPNTYLVALDAAGGRTNNNFYTAEYGSNYTIAVPEKEGYDFLGWYDAPTGGNAITNRRGAGIAPWTVASNEVTLYARWEIKTFVVQFESNGGTSLDPVTYTYGSSLVLPTPPKKLDVIFHGWFNEDGTTEYRNGMTVTGNITLYAQWIESTPVYDAAGLLAIKNAPNGNYHLMNDINLDGMQWSPIAEFSGILDGQGFKIFNFTVSNNNTVNSLGFILTNKGIIRNLNMEGVTFNYTRNTTATGGILTAYNKGTIRNCRITGGTAKYALSYKNAADIIIQIGIFAGENNGRIEGCYTNTPITGKNTTILVKWEPHDEHTIARVGGIAGHNSGTVYGCHTDLTISATGAVEHEDGSSTGRASMVVGGIVGRQGGGRIEACTTTATLSTTVGTVGKDSAKVIPYIGGIVGTQAGGVIIRCYADATVTGRCYKTGYVGGFIGWQSSGEINNSYSTSAVNCNSNDNNYAAFAGAIDGKVHNCYADSKNYNTSYYQYGFAEGIGSGAVISGCFSTLGSFSGSGGTKTNCHSAATDEEGNNPFKTDFIYTDLFWSETVWTLDGEGYPTLIGVKIPEEPTEE